MVKVTDISSMQSLIGKRLKDINFCQWKQVANFIQAKNFHLLATKYTFLNKIFKCLQLFEKIMCLDIEERHLLRLGHGEEELATEKDFSRYGRVNFILALRMELLKEVERLQVKQMGVDCSHFCLAL